MFKKPAILILLFMFLCSANVFANAFEDVAVNTDASEEAEVMVTTDAASHKPKVIFQQPGQSSGQSVPAIAASVRPQRGDAPNAPDGAGVAATATQPSMVAAKSSPPQTLQPATVIQTAARTNEASAARHPELVAVQSAAPPQGLQPIPTPQTQAPYPNDVGARSKQATAVVPQNSVGQGLQAAPVPQAPARSRGDKKSRPVLPGVEGSEYKVNSNLSHANVIRITGDGTENALVSIKFPNRIATPFSHPRIIDASSVTMQIDGSNIFASPKSQDPFAVFITGDEPGDPVVSLTLMPKDIPAQTIVLQLDAVAIAKRSSKVESYTQQMVDLLRQVGGGRIPEGYSEGRMPSMVAKQEGLTIIPETRYSGSWLDIYRYKVENNQPIEIELSETQFYQNGVKAVAIMPNTILKNGESATVFVVADKSMLDGAADNVK